MSSTTTNKYLGITYILCALLIGATLFPTTTLATGNETEEKQVTRSFIPINLRKDLPAYGNLTYGCKKVPANPNGTGCILDVDITSWTYTSPTGSTTGTTNWSPSGSTGGQN